jgi:hypothetical protein
MTPSIGSYRTVMAYEMPRGGGIHRISSQCRLQPLIQERLKGLEIRRHRVQPRPERRALRFLRHRRDNPRPAIRALHGEPPVLRHDRRYRGQLGPLRDADDLSWKIPMQEAATARTVVGTMLNNAIRIVAEHPAVTLVTRLGTAGASTARAAPCDPSRAASRTCAKSYPDAAAAAPAQSAPRGSIAQDRFGSSHEGISEIRSAQRHG